MIRRSIPVLCYHDVGPQAGHSLERFREHLDCIRDLGFTTIPAARLVDIATGRAEPAGREVVLTFDDGHASAWFTIAPELADRGMCGAFFACTDFVWEGAARVPGQAPLPRPMPDCFREALTQQKYEHFINSGEISALLDMGMEVYGHGCRHQGAFRTPDPGPALGHPKARWPAWGIYPEAAEGAPTFAEGSAYVYDGYWPEAAPGGGWRFRRRSPEERRAFCRDDLGRCLRRMRELTGRERQIFCWPWGQYDAVSLEELQAAGYVGAFSLERGANAPGSDPFRLHRLGVAGSKGAGWLAQRLRMYDTVPAARVFVKRFRPRPEVRRVLLATDSDKLSGGSRQLINNAAGLLDLGVEVHAAVRPDAPLAGELARLGCRLATFEGFGSAWATARFLTAQCRERGIDVVHTFHNRAYKGAVLAKALGAPWRLFIGRGVIFAPNLLFGLWSRIADGCIVNSEACADTLRRLLVPEKRLFVVYNAFVPEAPVPERPERDKRGARLVYVGNDAPAKGFDVFLRACARFCREHDPRDVEFVAIGVKKPEQFEAVLAPEVRSRLRLTGPLGHAEVMEELLAADALVLSSRQESLPNVLLEAFAAALPVVATGVGGVPELVVDGINGLVCPSEDAGALAVAMDRLARDPLLRRRMGRLNRLLVTTRLDNRTKALRLLTIYHGHRPPRQLDAGAVTRLAEGA
ncbi:MAG: glycosyltransferase [Desulfovibrionaceae bacterium]